MYQTSQWADDTRKVQRNQKAHELTIVAFIVLFGILSYSLYQPKPMSTSQKYINTVCSDAHHIQAIIKKTNDPKHIARLESELGKSLDIARQNIARVGTGELLNLACL